MYATIQKKTKTMPQIKNFIQTNVIQRKAYTSDELLELIRHNFHIINGIVIDGNSIDAEQLATHVDDDPGYVIDILITISLLTHNDTYASSGDEWDDPDYKAQRQGQFLNPTTLRRNLGGIGLGGEAHHIIPSCVAEVLVRDGIGRKNEYNERWNGILLTGTLNAYGNIINPLRLPSIYEAFHRNNRQHNHPLYNQYVINRLKTIKDLNYDKVQSEAEILENKISDIPKGCPIDVIS